MRICPIYLIVGLFAKAEAAEILPDIPPLIYALPLRALL